MKLHEIRDHLKKRGAYNDKLRVALVDWLATEKSQDMCMGITIMPKKIKYMPRKGVELAERHVRKDELVQQAKRFVHLLNSCVYKNAYRRSGKKLDCVMTVEGERSYKDLHCHFAFSKPHTMTAREFNELVKKALAMSDDFCMYSERTNAPQHKVDIADGEWMRYITKELDSKSFANLHLL